MRTTVLLVVVCLVGCSDDSASTLREQLATETALAVSPESNGTILADRGTYEGWHQRTVALEVEWGELRVITEPSGALLVQRLEVALAPFTISEPAYPDIRLKEIIVELVSPTRVETEWLDDSGRASARLQLKLSSTVTVNSGSLPVSSPRLAPMPVELVLTGGDAVHAELRVDTSGVLWSYVDEVRLADLSLALTASS